jgi:O-antigen ligase
MGNMAFFISFFSISLLFLYAATHFQKKIRSLFTSAIILLISMALIDLLIVGNWFGMDRIVERVGNTSIATEDRSDVFSDTLRLGKQFWLTGVGGGAFASSFPAIQSSNYIEIFDHVHNDYLEFVVELGIPVALLLSVVVAYALHSALSVMLKSQSRFYSGVAYASLLGVFSILLHSLADFNLHIPSNAAYFVVLLALAVVARFLNDEHSMAIPLREKSPKQEVL